MRASAAHGFRLHAWDLLKPALAGRIPPALPEMLADAAAGGGERGEAFSLDLGEPSAMDRWAPQVAAWRLQGVTWKEIAGRTGLKPANAHAAYKRYVGAGGDDASPSAADGA